MEMNCGRMNAVVATVTGKVIIAGRGVQHTLESSSDARATACYPDMYDVATGVMGKDQGFRMSRTFLAAASMGHGRYAIFGGGEYGWGKTDEVEVYDNLHDEWFPARPLSQKRTYIMAAGNG